MTIRHAVNAEHASPYSMLHCIQRTPTCRHQSVRRLDSICMQRILVTLHMSCKGSYAPQTQLLSTCTHMLSCLPHCFKIMPGDSYPNVTGMIIMVPHFKTVTRTCYSSMLMRHTQESAQKDLCQGWYMLARSDNSNQPLQNKTGIHMSRAVPGLHIYKGT